MSMHRCRVCNEPQQDPGVCRVCTRSGFWAPSPAELDAKRRAFCRARYGADPPTYNHEPEDLDHERQPIAV